MGIDPADIYFGLLCLASLLVLGVMLDYFIDYIQKDRDDE
jgi:hypothetical protein